jgi:hypothetical protein
MALKIRVLSMGQLTSGTPSQTLYTPTTTAPAQTAIVKAMRFSNITAGNLTLNVYFVPSGGTQRRILPKDLLLAPNTTFTDSDELTLGSGDAILAVASGGTGTLWVDCVITGVERDA